MKKIILIIFAVLIFSGIAYVQPQPLTDREILIQNGERINSIFSIINQIDVKVDKISEKIFILESKSIKLETDVSNLLTRNLINVNGIDSLETRATITEQSLLSIGDKLEGLTGSWNWIVRLFAALLIGIFVKGVFDNRKTNHRVN